MTLAGHHSRLASRVARRGRSGATRGRGASSVARGRRGARSRRARATGEGDDEDDEAVRMDDAFAPRMDARATVTSALVAGAFFFVNRRVAGAVRARRAREEAEARARETKLERLRGNATVDDDEEAEAAVAAALEVEAEARKLGIFRIRMPQPLGRPLREVRAEEDRYERFEAASSSRREEEERKTPPWWMTTTSAIVLVLLVWSAVGLGSVDRVANAPALSEEDIERFRSR